MTQKFHSWIYILKKNENTNSKRHMYHIVHSIIIYNAAMNLSVHQQMNGKRRGV